MEFHVEVVHQHKEFPDFLCHGIRYLNVSTEQRWNLLPVSSKHTLLLWLLNRSNSSDSYLRSTGDVVLDHRARVHLLLHLFGDLLDLSLAVHGQQVQLLVYELQPVLTFFFGLKAVDPTQEQRGSDLHPVPVRLCWSLTHLCSCAAIWTESIIWRRASEICLALTVCCSNFVFTADCEMHSYEEQPHYRTGHKPKHLDTSAVQLKSIKLSFINEMNGMNLNQSPSTSYTWGSHLKSSLKILEFKHSGLKPLRESSTWDRTLNVQQELLFL